MDPIQQLDENALDLRDAGPELGQASPTIEPQTTGPSTKSPGITKTQLIIAVVFLLAFIVIASFLLLKPNSKITVGGPVQQPPKPTSP